MHFLFLLLFVESTSYAKMEGITSETESIVLVNLRNEVAKATTRRGSV